MWVDYHLVNLHICASHLITKCWISPAVYLRKSLLLQDKTNSTSPHRLLHIEPTVYVYLPHVSLIAFICFCASKCLKKPPQLSSDTSISKCTMGFPMMDGIFVLCCGAHNHLKRAFNMGVGCLCGPSLEQMHGLGLAALACSLVVPVWMGLAWDQVQRWLKGLY